MPSSRSCLLVSSFALVVAYATGCDDPAGPPAPGAIMVVVQVQGADIPLGGYRASVDGGPTLALDSLNRRITVTGLDPRVYSVRLEGLAPNCSVVGSNPLSVTVASNQTALAQFTVACVSNFGTVRVTTVTTGGEQDPDGYMVMVDGVQRAPVGLNATVSITDVRVGLHAISLSNVAPNCRVFSPQSVNVVMAFQATVDVGFTIQCEAPGRLTVTVATTGGDVDPDGYTVDVESASLSFTESRSVAANGSLTFTLLPATDYRVRLHGVSANCRANLNPQTVEVTAGGTTSVTFDVVCEAPRLLAIERNGDIYAIRSNGTGATQLTTDPAWDGKPAWSSTGRIAFVTTRHSGDAELYVMNDDGTSPVRITITAGVDDAPSWSPDGQKIVFQTGRDVNDEIYIVNADGTGLTRLTTNSASDRDPAWSSTGKIAFISDRDHHQGEIYVMNSDGSNVIRLTTNDSAETGPAWSPDGSMLAFTREIDCYYYCSQDVFVMNADGSNVRRLTVSESSSYRADPSWSPDGRTIAFTNQYCPYYCDVPAVSIVDVQGGPIAEVTSNGAHPAWKP